MHLIFNEGSEPGRPFDDDGLVDLYRHEAPEDPEAVTLRSNFIASLDGSIQGPDGRSGSINTPSDHRLFALHRALSDAVLVGAGTARAEGYRAVDLTAAQRELRRRLGLAPFPTLVVVSRRGQLDPGMATPPGEHGPVLLVTTAAEVSPPDGADLLRLDGEELNLVAVARALAARGLQRVLCEGGPQLHRDLLAAGLVDQLSLTLAPVVVGGVGLRTTSGAPLGQRAAFRLRFALLAEDGALFTHYRRAAPE